MNMFLDLEKGCPVSPLVVGWGETSQVTPLKVVYVCRRAWDFEVFRRVPLRLIHVPRHLQKNKHLMVLLDQPANGRTTANPHSKLDYFDAEKTNLGFQCVKLSPFFPQDRKASSSRPRSKPNAYVE